MVKRQAASPAESLALDAFAHPIKRLAVNDSNRPGSGHEGRA